MLLKLAVAYNITVESAHLVICEVAGLLTKLGKRPNRLLLLYVIVLGEEVHISLLDELSWRLLILSERL